MERNRLILIGGILVIVILVILVVLATGIGRIAQSPWQGRGPGMMTGGYGPGNGTGYGQGYCLGMMCGGYTFDNRTGYGQGYGPGMMDDWYDQNNATGYTQGYCPDGGCGGSGYRNWTGYYSYVPTLLPPDNSSPLTESEIRDIQYLREEEQLAHDLYSRWADRYSLPVFSNIAEAETSHIQEVRLLMNRYGLSENQTGNASVGYHYPEIQSAYAALGPVGDSSLEGALNAGFSVEGQDIAALDSAIANTSRTDILQVWSNLRQGSLNHKAAFGMMLGR
ncbi:MAG: DUF2202 domain-containing protein [Methanoregulaceae archaeon]